jgi:hypothetical protein
MRGIAELRMDDPIRVTVLSPTGPVKVLCCRRCIARRGAKAQDILAGTEGFGSREEFDQHLALEHDNDD